MNNSQIGLLSLLLASNLIQHLKKYIEHDKITKAWDAMFMGGPIPEPHERPDDEMLDLIRLLRDKRRYDDYERIQNEPKPPIQEF